MSLSKSKKGSESTVDLAIESEDFSQHKIAMRTDGKMDYDEKVKLTNVMNKEASANLQLDSDGDIEEVDLTKLDAAKAIVAKHNPVDRSQQFKASVKAQMKKAAKSNDDSDPDYQVEDEGQDGVFKDEEIGEEEELDDDMDEDKDSSDQAMSEDSIENAEFAVKKLEKKIGYIAGGKQKVTTRNAPTPPLKAVSKSTFKAIAKPKVVNPLQTVTAAGQSKAQVPSTSKTVNNAKKPMTSHISK